MLFAFAFARNTLTHFVIAGNKIASHLPGRKSRVGGRDRTINIDFGQNLAPILHFWQNLALFWGV